MKETYLTDGAFLQSRPHLFLPQNVPKLYRECFRRGCHPVSLLVLIVLERWQYSGWLPESKFLGSASSSNEIEKMSDGRVVSQTRGILLLKGRVWF